MDTLVGIILTIVFLTIFGWAFYRSGSPTRLPDGSLELRFEKGVGFFGILVGVLVPVAIILALVFLTPSATWSDIVIALGLASAFAAYGLYYLGLYLKVRVEVRDDGIEKTNFWGKTQYLPWENIRRLYFSNNQRAFIVASHDYEELSVSAAMKGMQDFQEEYEKRLELSEYQGAREGYEKWRKTPFPFRFR